MKQKIIKWITLCGIMGFVYLSIEVIVRAIGADVAGLHGWTGPSLVGWSSLWMIPVGGASGAILGLFNERKKGKELKMFIQCILGALIILGLELVSGLILNKGLNLNIWDYSHLPFNIAGQVCLPFAGLWFLLCPFAFWIDDFLRFALYGEESKYGIERPYIKLFTLK